MGTQLGNPVLPKAGNHASISNQSAVMALGAYLLFHSAVILGYDLYEVAGRYLKSLANNKAPPEMTKSPRGKKQCIHNYTLLFVTQIVLYVCVILSVTIRLFRYRYKFGMSFTVNALTYSSIIISITYSLMYFFQFCPQLGMFASMILRTNRTTMKWFGLMYVFMAIGAIFVMHRIVNFGKITCDENFQTFYHSAYSVFLMTFKMLGFSDEGPMTNN